MTDNRNRIETLVNYVGSGLFAYTLPERKILLLNSEARRLFDCTENDDDYDFMMMIREKIIPEDSMDMRKMTVMLRKPGDYVEYSFHIKKDSGQVLTVKCNTKLLAFSDGQQYILSAMTDVTKQEKLENNLIEERRQYRDALTMNSNLFFTVDLTDGYIEQRMITKSGHDVLEDLGLYLPAAYDEVSELLMKKMHIVFLTKDANVVMSCDRLIELYSKGVSHFNGEYFAAASSRYYQVLILLSESRGLGGHLLANFVVYDITDRKLEEEKNRSLIDSLSSIYHSVYHCNIEDDRCEAIKIQERIEDRLPYNGTISNFIEVYVTEFVEPAFEGHVRRFLDVSTLNERFAKTDVLNVEYQRKNVGWCRGTMIITGRKEDGSVDSLIFAVYVIEERKQRDLQTTYEMKHRWQVIKSFSSIYFASWLVDLTNNQLTEIRVPEFAKGITESMRNDVRTGFQYLLEHFVAEDEGSVSEMADFLNIDTLSERIRGKEIISCEYLGRVSGWCRANFILVGENADRFVFAVQIIDEEKKKEHETKLALQQAFESARKANSAKTEFLTHMSHDIRTPMNAIIGMTTIAETHIDDRERVKDCLGKITVAGRHLLRLINEVLDMSKIESGQFELQHETFRLRDMIEELQTITRPQTDEKRQKFLVSSDLVGDDTVRGDCQRLQQVLLNLLGNSVKYTPEDGTIRFSVREKPTNKGEMACYEFVVEDNGIGMSEEYLARLFEPFSRAADERVDKIQGTGLGMSISRDIIRMMNGTLDVESRLNQGTRFTVTVSLECGDTSKLADNSGDEKGDVTQGELLPKKEFAGRRALLVEDNEINAEIAGEILGMTGLVLEYAADGREAVHKVEESADGYYDIVFMDVQMPIMDGYEATRALRKIQREYIQRLPIIAMTANAFAEDVQACKAAGMNEHIAKPIDPHQLLRVLNRWL